MSNVRLEQFIALVNERLLKGKKLTELNAIWEEVSFFPKCKELVRNGTRKGENCGKACVHGQEKCLCHLPRKVSEKKNECEFVLKSGPNKGNACGKKCKEEMCPSHLRDITPCIATLKNGNPCGVTCKEGNLCKKHQEKETEEEEKQEKPTKEKKDKKDKKDKKEKEKKEEVEFLSDVGEEVSDTSSVFGDEEEPGMTDVADVVDVTDIHEVAATAAVPEPEVVQNELCKNLLKNGANKGKECGRKCVDGKNTCSLHSK